MNNKVLIISEKQLKEKSLIELNTDVKTLNKIIIDCQELDLKPVLGSDVYQLVLNEIVSVNAIPNYTISNSYKELIESAIQPFLIHAVVCDFIVSNNYKLSNKGVLKLNDNSGSNVSADELEYFKNYHDNKKNGYKAILVSYLKEKDLIKSHTTDTNVVDNLGWFLPTGNYTPIKSSSSSDDFVGRQGVQGFQGLIGLQGVQGVQGIEGLIGTQGFQGVVGVQGFAGVQGLQGRQGSMGFQGVQGAIGLTGVQGSIGLQGFAGSQGFQGTGGVQGIEGLQGFQGRQGVVGTQGVQGRQGSTGTTGLQGFQGIIGSQGVQGTQGAGTNLGNTSVWGNITSSTGTGTNMATLGRQTYTDGSLMPTGLGLSVMYNSTGSTGFPTPFGNGIQVSRDTATLNSSFRLWKGTSTTDLYYQTGNALLWDSWQIFANQSWVDSTYIKKTGDTMTGSLIFSTATYDPDGTAGSGDVIPNGISYWQTDGMTNVPSSAGTIFTVKRAPHRSFQIFVDQNSFAYRALHNGVATSWKKLLNENLTDFYLASNAARLRAATTGNLIISANNAGTTAGAIYLRASGDTNTSGQFVIAYNGNIGTNTSPTTNSNFYATNPITGGTSAYGFFTNNIIQSDVTGSAAGYNAVLSTASASFTLPFLYYYRAAQGNLGAGSSITNQVGFQVDANLTGAANNFGFRAQLPAGSNNWNLYLSGTAQNYVSGSVGIGVITPSVKLDVAGAIKASDDLEVTDGTKGVILKSPSGNRFRITVSDSGVVTSTAL